MGGLMGCGMRLVWELTATWTGRDGGLVMDDNAAGCWMLDGCWIENASYCGWRRQPTKSRLAVETHDTDSGRLDMAGLTGALQRNCPACLPRELASLRVPYLGVFDGLWSQKPRPSLVSHSSTQGIASGRAVVVEAQRQKQTAETNGGRRHAAGTQSAGAQPAHNCWRLQRLDVRRWASV